jgi:hypothetical protein
LCCQQRIAQRAKKQEEKMEENIWLMENGWQNDHLKGREHYKGEYGKLIKWGLKGNIDNKFIGFDCAIAEI